MRFYLDNDVSVAVCRDLLTPAGHECWGAASAGRMFATDDEQTVYADDHDAVIITHDREFTARRKKNSIGRHVCLCCEQPDAVEVLAEHLDLVVTVLAARPHVVVEVRRTGFDATTGWG